MIICKQQGMQEISFINNSHPLYESGYSIVVQNTITKDITIYDTYGDGKLYKNFQIDIQLPQGEYYVLLFENPDLIPFKASTNNLKEVDTIKYATVRDTVLKAKGKTIVIGDKSIQYLASDDNLIMFGNFYLTYGSGEKQELKYIQSELMRIGEYKNPNKTYKKEQGYIQYKN